MLRYNHCKRESGRSVNFGYIRLKVVFELLRQSNQTIQIRLEIRRHSKGRHNLTLLLHCKEIVAFSQVIAWNFFQS